MADREKKRGEEENTKIWISQERKELLGLLFGEKKNWQKIADTSFKVSKLGH